MTSADEYSLDAASMTRSAVNGLRAVIGISGAVSLILGVVLLAWPEKTIAVFTIFLAIFFLIAGILRLGVGIFSRGISGGIRTLNIILGILLVLAGVVAMKDVVGASAFLVVLTIAFIGVGWMIEGVVVLVESGRSAHPGWSIAYGILSIIAGLVVLIVPTTSAVPLILFAGIALIVIGIMGIVRAFTFGRDILTRTTAAPAPA